MIINHNMASLNTYNKLSANNAQTSKALEKLSSGLRINRAGDDAAGLAISEKMRGQIRGLDQASRNAQDATSMLNTAEGNLSETQSILQRMKELATQAANDTNVGVDRNEIQKEINQLTSEINRIGNTTEFNTQKLLDGGGSKTTELSVATTIAGGKAGNISAVQTVVASAAGKSEATLAYTDDSANSRLLTIRAQAAGTDLNGWSFRFSETGAATSVGKTGAKEVTISGTFATMTAADLQTAINDSGLVTNPVVVELTDPATGNAAATALLGTTSLDTKATAAMTGGEAAGTRGVYSFDVSEAFVTDGDTFTVRIARDGVEGGWQDITLTARQGAAGANEFSIGTAATNRYDEATQATNIKTALDGNAAVNVLYDVSVSNNKIVLTEKADKINNVNVSKQAVTSTAVASSVDYTHSAQRIVQTGGKFTLDGVDIRVVDGSGADDAADVTAGKAILYDAADTATTQMNKLATAINSNVQTGSKYTASDAAGVLTLVQNAGAETSEVAKLSMSDKAGNGFTATFQIGANTAQSMTIQINDMRSQALKVSGTVSGASVQASNGKIATLKATKEVTNGTDNTSVEYALDVSDHTKATNAISVLEDAIESVSAERSKLGAYTNRLEHTVNNLTTSSENLTAAESRIRDVDMAKEMMNFQKNNILSQAAQAMLAQANQQPQGVLQLLR